MKIIVQESQIKNIAEDLQSANIKKLVEFSIVREYFDLLKDNNSVHPPSLPKQFYGFFTQLQSFAEKNKTLREQKVFIVLEEQCKDCTVLLIENGVKKSAIPFRQSGWAEIEEFFLVSGLVMIHSHEIERTLYFNEKINVVYEVCRYSEGTAYLSLEAQTIDQIIAGLTVIGLSIDVTKEFSEKKYYEYDLEDFIVL